MVGFVNEASVLQTSKVKLEWIRVPAHHFPLVVLPSGDAARSQSQLEQTQRELLVPVLRYKNETWRINNLHCHSKNLTKFYSLRGYI